MDNENDLLMDPEDIEEVTPTQIPVSDVFYTDASDFESTEIILNQYQYRVLTGQKTVTSILFVISLELLVMILVLCRRRK